MKKYLKWGGIILLIPISLFILLSILLYLPPIQNFVVTKVTQTVSESTGMDIRIGRVSLSFPIDLVVHETTVVNQKDTLLDVNRLKVEIQLWPLLKKQVEVDGLVLEKAKVNTGNLMEGMSFKGNLERFYVESHGVNLKPELAIINTLELENTHLDIVLSDTSATDTTATDPLFWKIMLKKANFDNVSFSLAMPLDSLNMNLALGEASLREGFVDLHKSSYSLDRIYIKKGKVGYTSGNQAVETEETAGFNPSNIQLSDIKIGMNSIYFEGDQLRANIVDFVMKERSGLEIIGTKGKLLADEKHISIPTFEIKTADSHLQMNASANWSLSNIDTNGSIKADFLANISKKDLFKFVPDFPDEFKKAFPEVPIQIKAGVSGSLNHLNLNAFNMDIPEHANITTQGAIQYPLDSIRRHAYIELKGDFQDMQFMQSYMGNALIPQGTTIESIAEMNKDTLRSTFSLLTAGQGEFSLKGQYNLGNEAYVADMTIKDLNLHAFLPKDSLFHITAAVKASGQGFDFLSPRTSMQLEGSLSHFQYAKSVLSGIKLTADVKDAKAAAKLDITDNHMAIYTELNAHLHPEEVKAELVSAIKRLDLRSLGISDITCKTSSNIKFKVRSDLKDTHSFRANISKNSFTIGEKSFKSKDVLLGCDLTPDSIKSYANAGDLTFMFQSGSGLNALLEKMDQLGTLITSQMETHTIDQTILRKHLPDAHLRVLSGNDNPVNNLLEANGIGYSKFFFKMDASPEKGMKSEGYLYQLHTDSLMLDTIHIDAEQVAKELIFKGGVIANRSKKQEGFTINLLGNTGERNAQFIAEYLNEKKEQGAYIGLNVLLEKKGISIRVIPEQPTLVYRPFHVNKHNYVFIDDKGRIQADLSLFDENHSGLHFYSTPDSTVQQDLTVLLNKIDIAEFRRIVPYMPDIAGLVSAETHYVQPYEDISLASVEASVDQLAYNKEPMGDWALSAVYLPKEKGEHCIDGFILRNDQEIASVNGSYFTTLEGTTQDWIDANVHLNHFPLNLANAFVSRKMAVLNGDLDGNMSMKGSTSKPVFNGEIILDSVNVFIPPASMNLRFDERPIQITDSKLIFDKFNIFTLGKSPFIINGDINFSDFSAMMLDLRMTADDFELVNGKRTKESLVYGKLYIDIASTIKGTPDALKVRGAANILGKSDFTYILKDSPLTVEDRLGETVTFVNFSDTTQAAQKNIQSISLGGIDMLMALHIDQAVQGKVDLNANGSNYMIVEGGGDLSFQYTPEGNMYMNGRYSLISGEMKYEMPVIPLKTFKIQNGSFIEWTGNVMNPTLSIKAFEKVRASVSDDGKSSRMVTFNVGVNLTNRLENLGFTFTLEAPEDGSVQDELAAMSAEEKNKLAVTMLVTGLYIAESNASGGLNANSALNSYLQSQINDIAGSALKTIDINFGMEKNDQGESGQSRTDYNFQFAKRFWNNRFRVVIGGKISTGNAAKQSDSFIDNVSLEYRLDNSGTRYIKVFHDKKYASVLEGEVIETGAGIVLRKKVSRIGELFIFKKRKRNQNLTEDKNDEKSDNKKKDN